MTEIPLRSLNVSNFRRIEGSRHYPLDASVVLIHGPNGSGKTSVLSALELGLTGGVRSMERQDAGYAEHLPNLGAQAATVRVEVADYLQADKSDPTLTINGGRVQGAPAFQTETARFYGDRCYLDQASLGRLLELYQHREGKGESALARFVNELLGLEKLDALRAGLHEATDLRLLKKLVPAVSDADTKAKAAAKELQEARQAAKECREELAYSRSVTVKAVEALRPGASKGKDDAALIEFVRADLASATPSAEAAEAMATHEELIALGGRISALIERPSTTRLLDARSNLATASTDRVRWAHEYEVSIQVWKADAQPFVSLQLGEFHSNLRQVLSRAEAELESVRALRVKFEAAKVQLVASQAQLDEVQVELESAREHSSALIESLVVLRTVVDDNNCPVCDRDYTEVNREDLVEHIESKLDGLTAHGQQLIEMRKKRDAMATLVNQFEIARSQLEAQLPSTSEQRELEERVSVLVALARRLNDLEPAILEGQEIDERVKRAQKDLEDLEAATSEDLSIREMLESYASQLRVDGLLLGESPRQGWQQLVDKSTLEIARLNKIVRELEVAVDEAARLAELVESEAALARDVADAERRKIGWESRVAEAKRRQAVAKEVHEAATRARATVVQRVFTESLNDVWKSVFTRLAPDESFVPSFGIPTADRTALNINLETTHRSGRAGGSPQMMLSAGNLNTAALSLFISLHLAVQPDAPCLVFDDPVQAMDEVHVAQFAALVRSLSKHHQRQVVIAVHERELFEYLVLELSPAFEGDELITIELGDRSDDEDQGVVRYKWRPDVALAV